MLCRALSELPPLLLRRCKLEADEGSADDGVPLLKDLFGSERRKAKVGGWLGWRCLVACGGPCVPARVALIMHTLQ